MKIFGFKSTNDSSMFPEYTVRGFCIAETVEEACIHFGVKYNNGYTSVCEVTPEQFQEEVEDSHERETVEAPEIQREMELKLALIRSVADDIRRVQAQL